MTAVYWILGIAAYLAIAVGVMRWRTARIDAGKAWRIIMYDGELSSSEELDYARKFTTPFGLFWPLTVVMFPLIDLLILGICRLFRGIDWTMRKLAGLPRK